MNKVIKLNSDKLKICWLADLSNVHHAINLLNMCEEPSSGIAYGNELALNVYLADNKYCDDNTSSKKITEMLKAYYHNELDINWLYALYNNNGLLVGYAYGKEEVKEVEIGGKRWRVIHHKHTPKTPFHGFTNNAESCEYDWKVMNISEGELWMNSCDAYMYIIGENVTYVRFF